MRASTKAGFLSLSLFLLGLSSAPRAAAAQILKIELLQNQKSVKIGAGAYQLKDLSTGAARKVTFDKDIIIRAAIGGLILDDETLVKKISLTPASAKNGVVLNDKSYRGGLILYWREPDKVQVINEVKLDDYVRGVLGVETAAGWSLEALKVQAIVSRTFAMRNIGRHSADGFDLCNQTHCQVYADKSKEYALTNRAVDETLEQVMMYKSEFVNAYFHSTCGGSTEDAAGVWEGPGRPYLKAINCRWCRESPRFSWRVVISDEDIERNLAQGGYRIGRLRRIQILQRERSGRVSELRIFGSKGKATLRGNAFRLLVGPDKVKSTLWTAMSHKSNSWLFIGNGWGHGVGLCQWGSKFMADKGKTAAQILKYYYRGISIEKWKG